MKLIYEPKVVLVSRQTFADPDGDLYNETGFVVGTNGGTEPETMCEVAGRTCYQSFKNPRPGGNPAYLQHIKESGHGSVLEHAVWSFIFSGVSRSLTHELVRHRAGFGYSQLSQRYVDESDVAFVVPPELQDEVRSAEYYRKHYCTIHGQQIAGCEEPDKAQRAGLMWMEGCEDCLSAYKDLADYLTKKIDREKYEESADKVSDSINFPHGTRYENWTPSKELKTEIRKRGRQTARSVLPNCTESKIFVTANARAWRTFIEQRGSKHAETEIRRLAYKVWTVLVKEAPNLFGDYKWDTQAVLKDGVVQSVVVYDVTTPYRKV